MPDSKTIDADADLASLVGTVAAQTAGEGAIVVATQRPVIADRAESSQIRGAILQLVSEHPDTDIAKVDALVKMQNDLEDRQAAREFTRAFTRLQGALPAIKKDGKLEYENEKGKPEKGKYLVTKYAKWEDILAAITPILAEHGFALSFETAPRPGDGGGLIVTAVLEHEGGHMRRGSPIPVALDTSGGKNNTQAYGSSMSYGQRYSAKAALNLRWEGEDDDGAASGALPLRAAGADGRAQALRIKELVDAAGIAGKERDPTVRRAAVRAWLTLNLSYVPADPETDFTYLDIRQEDYARIVRLLRIEVDNAKAAAEQEARL